MKKADQQVSMPVSRPLIIALVVALAVGVWLLKSFFALIITAMIVAYVFRPVYLWLLKRVKRDSTAAALTLLATLLAIAVPIVIVVLVTIWQATTIINNVGSSLAHYDINKISTDLVDWINQVLSQLTNGHVSVTSEQIWAQLSGFAADVASFVLDTLKGWVGGIGSLVTNAILYMYVFTGVLVHHDKLTKLFTKINPLDTSVSDLYLTRAGSMTRAMVRGQFIIAVLQGLVSAIGLSVAGVPYFAFFLLILTFLSIIPLGAGIVTIPIGIVNIALGNYWQGILILLNHFVIVTNIDNVLKPKLVPKSVRLHPALLLLAIFGGLGIFGFLGIIIGPVIMILITTTIEVYLKVSDKAPARPVETA